MDRRDPVEFSGKVLDKRNTLTAPKANEASYPERPKHVKINKTDK
ncbi:hypothetical protein [Niallia taxi]|nr:hypothetical protein [Niallia taxi]MDE5052153.1 hypothetical protein [Niallia taxi]MED3962007.1 hypothetical protein [Niallia taxi]WOD64350.1 hypothetical protein NQZ71_08500 [Niallia taxi]